MASGNPMLMGYQLSDTRAPGVLRCKIPPEDQAQSCTVTKETRMYTELITVMRESILRTSCATITPK